MSSYPANFLLLDYQIDKHSFLFSSSTHRLGVAFNQSKFIPSINYFFSTIINTYPSIFNWNFIGLEKNIFFHCIEQSPNLNNSSTTLFSYPENKILDLIKKNGFNQGIHQIMDDLFIKKDKQIYFIISDNFQQLNKNHSYLSQHFYKQLAHDLHSQPIWWINLSSLENSDSDCIFLEFNFLVDTYYFLNTFWFIVYDEESGYLENIVCDRSLIQDKKKFEILFNSNFLDKNSRTKNWRENWKNAEAQKLIEKVLPNQQGLKLKISPLNFKKNLIIKARESSKKILLVEGHDLRVLKSIEKSLEVGVSNLAVLGEEKEIKKLLQKHDIKFSPAVEIIEPKKYHQKYTNVLHQLLKAKNLSLEMAQQLIQEDLYLAGVLLQQGKVDGVIAGAHYSTAATLKAAIRVVGVETGHSLISSFFLMLLPQDVMLLADCAVNPNPNPEQLADITIQSIESAQKFFNLPINVSLISFSTLGSASTPEVEKIKQTLEIVHQKINELGIKNTIVEGPVQYDTATNFIISKKKYPESRIAGNANVLIFPNLETGNTVYKAIQQNLSNMNCHSIGPIIQGLKKPFNDLSRGSTIEDIFQTILITAMQTNKAF